MKSIISFLLLTILFASCKSTAQQSAKPAKEGSYYEDLSLVRPMYEVVEDSTSIVDLDTVAVPSMEKTEQIDSVITRVANYNEQHPPNIKGFRVQIYNGGSQSKANRSLKTARKVLGEDIYGESKWTSPVFRTRVGCFVDRLNAYKVLLKLKDDFPNALVVPDNKLSVDCVH
jgi:hypothetical protein